jgi:hypothetical protein
MNTSNTRVKHVSSTVGTIVMALVFAVVIGTISPVPALSQENNRRQGYQDGTRQQRLGYEESAWRQRRWHERQWQGERGRRAYQPYVYSPPIYVPPPVVYAPYRSPGISLFFPFHIP